MLSSQTTLAAFGLLLLALPSSATSLRKPSCVPTLTCSSASALYNGESALLKVPVAAHLSAKVLGQSVDVVVCSYTTVLSDSRVFGDATCVYVATNGLLNTQTSVKAEININPNVNVKGFSCPTSLSQSTCTGGPAPPSASLTPVEPVKVCSRKPQCPPGTYRSGGLLSFNLAAKVGAKVELGTSLKIKKNGAVSADLAIDALVCSYTSLSILSTSLISLRSTTCIYNLDLSLDAKLLDIGAVDVNGAVKAGVSVGLDVLGSDKQPLLSQCPPLPTAQTCKTVTPSRRRRSVESDAIASRLWSPKKSKSARSPAWRAEKRRTLPALSSA